MSLLGKDLIKSPEIDHIYLGWFHRYPARFSLEALKQIFSVVISRLGKLPKNILDPFAGTGSSLSFAKQLNIPAVGKELTDLGILISKVRLYPPEDLNEALDIAKDLVSYRNYGDCKEVSDELVTWIGIENAAKLEYLIWAIDKIEDYKIKNWLKLALSSAIRPSSRWLAGSIKPQIDPKREYSDIYKHFVRSAKKLKKDCENEARRFCEACPTKIIKGDSKKLEFKNETFDCIITSPPYGSMYDYYDVHRLTYLAFGWEINHFVQIGRGRKISRDGFCFTPPKLMKDWYYNCYKGESTIKGRALRAYFQDMEKHFNEIYRVLQYNGAIAYSLANSIKKGRKFQLVEALAEIIYNVGFREIEIIPRKHSTRRILPAGRDPISGRFSSNAKPVIDEYVIFAKKK